MLEHDLDASAIKCGSISGRITRKDVEVHLANGKQMDKPTAEAALQLTLSNCYKKRTPLTRLHKRLFERLLEAKESTPMLTTFD